MEWMFLGLAALVYVAGCWLTYNNDLKPYWWYIPLGVALGGVINAIWFWAAKTFTDKDKMYVFGLTWDGMLMGIYYLMPLILFGTKLDRWGWLGLILIVAGAMILKVRS